MAEVTATEEVQGMDETRKRLKEIYSFTFEKKEKVKKTETKTQKNEDTGEDEEVSVTKEVEEAVPYRIVLKQPNRRQIEEAELEFSVEMSNCVKKGILTKAMLAKKYSDTGGLLTEEDATSLSKAYIRFGELTQESQKIQIKSKPTKEDKKKLDGIAGEIAILRKNIIALETSYSNLFNHTADIRAENKVIRWYILNLTYIQKDEEEEMTLLFEGNTFEQQVDRYYELEEEGDEVYDLVGGKVATLMSFWYYSSGAVSREDFKSLDEDIESGEV